MDQESARGYWFGPFKTQLIFHQSIDSGEQSKNNYPWPTEIPFIQLSRYSHMSLTKVTQHGPGECEGMEIQLYFKHKPEDPVLVTVLMTTMSLMHSSYSGQLADNVHLWERVLLTMLHWEPFRLNILLRIRQRNLGWVSGSRLAIDVYFFLGINKYLFLANEGYLLSNMTPISKYSAKLFYTLCSISSESQFVTPAPVIPAARVGWPVEATWVLMTLYLIYIEGHKPEWVIIAVWDFHLTPKCAVLYPHDASHLCYQGPLPASHWLTLVDAELWLVQPAW